LSKDGIAIWHMRLHASSLSETLAKVIAAPHLRTATLLLPQRLLGSLLGGAAAQRHGLQ